MAATRSPGSTSIGAMSDAQQMRLRLGTAFIEHVGDLWPEGEPAAKPE
jgi:hypothetical protein